jgi:hypothetical protein
MIPSFNLQETVSFFSAILQFKIARDDKQYIIVYKKQPDRSFAAGRIRYKPDGIL